MKTNRLICAVAVALASFSSFSASAQMPRPEHHPDPSGVFFK